MKKRKVSFRWEYTTIKVKNPSNTNIFGPYLKAVIYYGDSGLSTCLYIGRHFKFPTLEIKNGRWKKFMRNENVK